MIVFGPPWYSSMENFKRDVLPKIDRVEEIVCLQISVQGSNITKIDDILLCLEGGFSFSTILLMRFLFTNRSMQIKALPNKSFNSGIKNLIMDSKIRYGGTKKNAKRKLDIECLFNIV